MDSHLRPKGGSRRSLSKPFSLEALDKRYRDWISHRPSCLSGLFSEYVDGVGRTIACHTRRAATSGTAYKPLFACLPLRHDEHLCQHQHGEAEALKRYGPVSIDEPTVEEAKTWFDVQTALYREHWLRTLTPELQEIVREALQ